MFSSVAIKDLSPQQVNEGLWAGNIVLIDVREPEEFRSDRIGAAVNIPLSRLETVDLPDAPGKTLVMQCAGGVRSAKAVAVCRKRGLKVDHHLAGGINAWKACGLQTVR